MGLEVRLYGIEEVIKVVCSAAVPLWVGNIEDSCFCCFRSNILSAVFPVCFYQLGILHPLLSILLDGIVEHFSLFLHHLSHWCNHWLRRRVRLNGVVTQEVALIIALAVAQRIFQVGSVFFVVLIVLVLVLIFLRKWGASGENRSQ